MRVAMHNAAQKMLPIAFFLYIAVVTVDSENFGMWRTLLKVYLLLFYGCTARFKIGSVNLELEPLYEVIKQYGFFWGGGVGGGPGMKKYCVISEEEHLLFLSTNSVTVTLPANQKYLLSQWSLVLIDVLSFLQRKAS